MEKKIALALLFLSLQIFDPTHTARAQTSALERARLLEPFFLEAGRLYGVEPRLLWTVAWIESRFRTNAVSPKGAGGVMQLMPATARRFGVGDRFDARSSIHGGAKYLRYLQDFFGGDLRLTLAAYNAGEGAVLRHGRRVPPFKETLGYVREGMATFGALRKARETAADASAVGGVGHARGGNESTDAARSSALPQTPAAEAYMPVVVEMDDLSPLDGTAEWWVSP